MTKETPDFVNEIIANGSSSLNLEGITTKSLDDPEKAIAYHPVECDSCKSR